MGVQAIDSEWVSVCKCLEVNGAPVRTRTGNQLIKSGGFGVDWVLGWRWLVLGGGRGHGVGYAWAAGFSRMVGWSRVGIFRGVAGIFRRMYRP